MRFASALGFLSCIAVIKCEKAGALSNTKSVETKTDEKNCALPRTDIISEKNVNEVILKRAGDLNRRARESGYQAGPKMPAVMRDAACIHFPDFITNGNRVLIYRRVNKAATQTAINLFKALWQTFSPSKTGFKMDHHACNNEFLAKERAAGAFDIAIIREPLDRFVSGFFFLGRQHKKWGTLEEYVNRMHETEFDLHGLPQAYFYAHATRRFESHNAVIQLEKIDEEWPALIQLAFAGADEDTIAKALNATSQVPQRNKNLGFKAGSVKSNPLGGGPGSGQRWFENRTHDEQNAITEPLCKYLTHDYDLFEGVYLRPVWCQSN